MAKKKIPTVEDALKSFTEVMQRASLSNYHYVNRIMLSKNDKKHNILIIPDPELWIRIIDDESWKPFLTELNISNPDERELQPWFEYGEDLIENWIPIEMKEELFAGKVFKISVNGFEYQIPISRDLMPMKLRKAEYDNIGFKIFRKPLIVLAIKKRFDSPVENCGFSMIRLFQII